MPESALDRLFRETSGDNTPEYSLDDEIDMMSKPQEDDTLFINGMSDQSLETLKSRVLPPEVEEVVEEEKEQQPAPEEVNKPEIKEESVKVKPQKVQKQRVKKNKDVNTAEAFLESLAHECIDIMIQQGVTIHGFNEKQMSAIWDFIKEKLEK